MSNQPKVVLVPLGQDLIDRFLSKTDGKINRYDCDFELAHQLRAALQEEGQVEERVEYRVVGDRKGGCRGVGLTGVNPQRRIAEARARASWPAYDNVRVQSRLNITGPWTDLSFDGGES